MYAGVILFLLPKGRAIHCVPRVCGGDPYV
nr:MAG TPA: hypothetical protein [Caudoviricetes sp.]